MKKIFIVAVATLFSFGVFAQNDTYKSTVSANVGFSLVGGLMEAISTAEGVDNSSLPALQLNYDFGVAKWFSVGAAFSYQKMGIKYSSWEMEPADFSVNINRTNIAARFLFHYANSGVMDLYSGLRVGYTMWGTNAKDAPSSFDPENELDIKGGTIAPQLVLFGLRGYVTDNIGLSTEIAIGAPHFFTLGVNYRF